MASLLLAGAVSAQTTNYWGNDPDSHAQPSNTPIVASVQIDDVAVTINENMRLGAFVGNDLRGIAAPHTDGNFWIQVFYTAQTDNITFKFYNGTTEYTTCATTLAGQTVTLTGQDEGYGTPTTPVVLNFTTEQTMTQTTELESGWNWWSTPIELGSDGLQILENALGENGEVINAFDGSFVQYVPDWSMWWGNPFQVVNESMYEINVNNTAQMELSGVRANPADHDITISQGWNWIGYLAPTTLPVNTALASLTPQENDIIQSREGFSAYWPGYGFWGNVTEMSPGKGYKYMSNNETSQTLVYPSGRLYNNVKNGSDVTNDNAESLEHQFLMSVVAVIEDSGCELRNASYEIQAISNNRNCGRSILRYCEPLDRYVAMLTVYGDNKEQVDFQVRNVESGEMFPVLETLTFANEKVVGSLSNPYVLHMNRQDKQSFALKDIYPNPIRIGEITRVAFNGSKDANEKVRLEVFNEMGEMLSSQVVTTTSISFVAPSTAGVYVIRLICGNDVFYGNLIVTQQFLMFKIVKK